MQRSPSQARHRPSAAAAIVVSGVLALVIALLTVSYQALKASFANPVDTLRYE